MLSEAVRRQLVGPAKCGGAFGADKLRRAGVQQAVLTQVGRLGEGTVTDVAAVRANSRMDEGVAHQIGQQGESFTTV